ncbi:MAG: aminotransferase class I/II-fold pyridoxal phosphate-dependent enzyme [Terracidiphilus sp.]
MHPNNPTGHFTKPWEREQLANLCREFNLSLIVDEVFLDYVETGNEGTRERGNEEPSGAKAPSSIGHPSARDPPTEWVPRSCPFEGSCSPALSAEESGMDGARS